MHTRTTLPSTTSAQIEPDTVTHQPAVLPAGNTMDPNLVPDGTGMHPNLDDQRQLPSPTVTNPVTVRRSRRKGKSGWTTGKAAKRGKPKAAKPAATTVEVTPPSPQSGLLAAKRFLEGSPPHVLESIGRIRLNGGIHESEVFWSDGTSSWEPKSSFHRYNDVYSDAYVNHRELHPDATGDGPFERERTPTPPEKHCVRAPAHPRDAPPLERANALILAATSNTETVTQPHPALWMFAADAHAIIHHSPRDIRDQEWTEPCRILEIKLGTNGAGHLFRVIAETADTPQWCDEAELEEPPTVPPTPVPSPQVLAPEVVVTGQFTPTSVRRDSDFAARYPEKVSPSMPDKQGSPPHTSTPTPPIQDPLPAQRTPVSNAQRSHNRRATTAPSRMQQPTRDSNHESLLGYGATRASQPKPATPQLLRRTANRTLRTEPESTEDEGTDAYEPPPRPHATLLTEADVHAEHLQAFHAWRKTAAGQVATNMECVTVRTPPRSSPRDHASTRQRDTQRTPPPTSPSMIRKHSTTIRTDFMINESVWCARLSRNGVIHDLPTSHNDKYIVDFGDDIVVHMARASLESATTLAAKTPTRSLPSTLPPPSAQPTPRAVQRCTRCRALWKCALPVEKITDLCKRCTRVRAEQLPGTPQQCQHCNTA